MTRCVIICKDGPKVIEASEASSVWARMDCRCDEPKDVNEAGEKTSRCYECGYTVRTGENK